MARVSKQSLSSTQENELVAQLTEVMGRMNATAAEHFIFEFFGREEKIMFAKRLAIIALIHEQRPLHRIAVYLHVSETTVGKLSDRYERGEFRSTIQALTKNKTDYTKFLDLLDSILTVGGIMPHRNYIIKSKR
jgi:uncharacterized protein YerC